MQFINTAEIHTLTCSLQIYNTLAPTSALVFLESIRSQLPIIVRMEAK